MRITLELDDDVLLAAREHATRECRSIGSVISDLARESLRRPTIAARTRQGRQGGRFTVLPLRDEVVTFEHVRGLQDAEGA